MDSLDIRHIADPIERLAAEMHAMPAMDMATQVERWKSFRKLYKFYERELMAATPYEYVIDRYELQWDKHATPIELSAWADITYSGIVMYPQYPIGRYFADYANPKLKIVLELDGKHWHDPSKDAQRDTELAAQGWVVYRVPGSECQRVINLDQWIEQWDEPEALSSLSEWAFRTSSGVIEGIKNLHFPDLAYWPQHEREDALAVFLRNKYSWSIQSAQLHRTTHARPRCQSLYSFAQN